MIYLAIIIFIGLVMTYITCRSESSIDIKLRKRMEKMKDEN